MKRTNEFVGAATDESKGSVCNNTPLSLENKPFCWEYPMNCDVFLKYFGGLHSYPRG
jgi:hypothetical protein